MAFGKEKFYINRTDKALKIKVGDIYYVGSIANFIKWLEEKKKNNDGNYYGFALSNIVDEEQKKLDE